MGKRSAAALEACDGRNGVWSINSWCLQAGMSHVKLLQLDPPPNFVKLGRLKRIVEAPHEYMERVRQLQLNAARNTDAAIAA